MSVEQANEVFRSNRTPVDRVAEAPAAPAQTRRAILVISETRGIGEKVAQAIGSEEEFDVDMEPRPIRDLLAEDATEFARYDIVVFEAHPNDEAEMTALRTLRDLCPEKTNFLAITTESLTLAYAKLLMDIRIDEVLPIASVLPEYAKSGAGAEPQPQPEVRDGTIVTLSSTRGGIGATTLALNMAFALTKLGKRATQAERPRVAVVDLDFQNGTLGSSVDIEDTGAYLSMLKGKRAVDAKLLREAMVPYKDRFDVLPAPVEFAPLESMTSAKITALLAELQAAYDYVILDLPRALTGWIAPILDRTDKMLIVSDTAVPSMRQARRLIDLYTEENAVLPIDIVVSKEKKPFTKSEAVKEAEKLLERPLDIWLPRDTGKARKAGELGQPMLEVARKTAISKPLDEVVAQVKELRATKNRREAEGRLSDV